MRRKSAPESRSEKSKKENGASPRLAVRPPRRKIQRRVDKEAKEALHHSCEDKGRKQILRTFTGKL
jgi:hypothetical protein